MPLELTYFERDDLPYYSDREMPRNESYKGRARVWDLDEARSVQGELLAYFGSRDGFDLPPPPAGLPGRSFYACHETMEILSLGLAYFAALVEGMPGRQWSIHEKVTQKLRDFYHAGYRDEFDRNTQKAVDAATQRYLENGFPVRDDSEVYFIASEAGPIKIGIAIDPVKRLKGLQTSHHDRLSILVTRPGGREQETAYHQQFAEHRLHGEWFARHPDILAEISRLNEQVPA